MPLPMLSSHRIILAALLLLGAATSPALAQDSTTGAVRGLIIDKPTGEPAIGATVVATSPDLQGQRTEMTDESGTYYFPNLPPGTYLITVHYLDARVERTNVLVQLGQVSKVNVTIDTAAAKGETIKIEGRAPLIDQQSTKNAKVIDSNYTRNLPTGRTFEAVIESAPGAAGDSRGVSFGGSTSTENSFVVDGVNVTDPVFSILRAPLPNDFVRETEVIQGGYSAEYGRATGALVNVITKSGSNEFHGTVFTYWSPGQLVAEAKETPSATSAISGRSNRGYELDMGAELGGPIVKDRLWFHVGVNPSFQRSDIDRSIKMRVDKNQDGIADIDENGFTVFEEIARSQRFERSQQWYYTGKITGAVSPDHQGVLSATGSPRTGDFVNSILGPEESNTVKITSLLFDGVAKWTSKFNDGRSQVDAVAGYHWDKRELAPTYDSGDGSAVIYGTSRPLTDYMEYEGSVPVACDDNNPNDPYPLIVNCPVRSYRTGGYGYYEEPMRDRLTARIDFTQRVPGLLGHHEFKIGGDIEDQRFAETEGLSGGVQYSQETDGRWQLLHYLGYDEAGTTPCGGDIDGDGMPDARCERSDSVVSTTNTRNISAYARDSWSIRPNLTLNAGLRWEQQTLFVAEEIQGLPSAFGGGPIDDVAMNLSNMLAPRVGVIYDPTQEGRARMYTHYGRFYESVPMGVNWVSFGGTSYSRTFLPADGCDLNDPAATCDESTATSSQVFGGSEGLVSPGMRAQYMDELIAGGEYELLPDLKVGAAYIRRDLGRVIEDMSTDGGNTYVFGNPGEIDAGAIENFRSEAEALRMQGDEDGAALKEYLADQFEAVGRFDKPTRIYNGLQLTADRRFTDRFYVSAAYTYARLKGNHPGLFETDTGNGQANVTILYDFPDILSNRYGDLPGDRPHLFKVDSYYRVPLPDSELTFGGRFRAQSGQPMTVRGRHPISGSNFILPRGSEVTFEDDEGLSHTLGRSPMTLRVDSHIGYARKLPGNMSLEAFVDIFNMFNQQEELSKDQTFTFDRVNSIVGGNSEDLRHAKKIVSGNSVSEVISRNPNFGNTSSRQAPLSARFGLRLMF